MSSELRTRQLEPSLRDELDEVRAEFERGDDLTQRLTRQFYKSTFNDFLFNNFGIHHLHFGPRDAVRDRTGTHRMSRGGNALLFALVTQTEAYFLDVLDHDTFGSAEGTKALARIALRDRRDLLSRYIMLEGFTATRTFESAFDMAKSGFCTAYQLDGVSFSTGGTVMDGSVGRGQRGPSTSIDVIGVANRTMNLLVNLLDWVRTNVSELGRWVEQDTGVAPSEFKLIVVHAGTSVVLREMNSGVTFNSDGRLRWYQSGQDVARHLPEVPHTPEGRQGS
jgi:hypothetical protein